VQAGGKMLVAAQQCFGCSCYQEVLLGGCLLKWGTWVAPENHFFEPTEDQKKFKTKLI
jgi:hypothetical protein